MTKSALFYVTWYTDHLNEITPEFPVLWPTNTDFSPGARSSAPRFMVRDLRAGEKIPGVRVVTPPPELKQAEYWVCDWNDADMTEMNVAFEYDANDDYIDQWPDAWFMERLYVNAKARAAFEKHAPDKCLFFPVKFFSKKTGELLDIERWMLFTRHWFKVPLDNLPLPKVDFDSASHSSLFRLMQNDPEVARVLNEIGLFSGPGASRAGHSGPIYSADLFHKLKAEGITGLSEKTSNSITFHDFREVITHVWHVSDYPLQ